MPRLAQTERELSAATAEFTEGYEARFGPLPCLHEAQEAMDKATASLEAKDAKNGRASEATALADLIKARQNLRKLLSQSSSEASACRNFDNQQAQKLRPSPRKKDDKEKLAQLQQEIEQLAKDEKKFSEEIDSPSGGGAQLEQTDKQEEKGSKESKSKSKSGSSASSSSSSSQKSAQSKPSLADRQDAAARKAQELQQLVDKDDALTDLARERMDAAADKVKASAQAMHAGRDKEAGKEAADAAEQLERLAKQVAALKSPDLANRLASTESLAQELATKEQSLGQQMQNQQTKGSKSGSGDGDQQAKSQSALSEEARTLADLLNRNQADAADVDSELARALREAGEKNPPGEIAGQMRRAADAMRAGKRDQAGRDASDASKKLDALAQQLDSTRRALTQPQLEKLMAAEKQAAEVQKALSSVANSQQKAEAEKKMTDLRETMDSLKSGDGQLAEAANALAQAVQRGGSQWRSGGETPRGMYKPPVIYVTGVTRTMHALQSRIQELILKDALLDKDEAVPPQYKKYVEEYYRMLSEDLRK